MSENNSTDDVRPVKAFSIDPFNVYPKSYIDEHLTVSPKTWSIWHKRGLKPLNSRTAIALYLGSDLIDTWKKED